ncbi:hypothetical protein AAMO2058_001382400 [Amorphochlora amoebiformis]
MREERESKGGGGILTEIPGSVGGKKSIEKPELWVHSLKRRLDIIVTQGDNRGQPVGSPKIVKSRDSWIKTWYSPDNRVVPKEALKRPREPVEQTDRKVVPRQEYFLSRQSRDYVSGKEDGKRCFDRQVSEPSPKLLTSPSCALPTSPRPSPRYCRGFVFLLTALCLGGNKDILTDLGGYEGGEKGGGGYFHENGGKVFGSKILGGKGMERMALRRFRAEVAYDGSEYFGWQKQPNNIKTVQDTIEQVLKKIFKRYTPISGCSRTDSGVHARGQVFTFDSRWPEIDNIHLLRAIRFRLPTSIDVYKLENVGDNYSCRRHSTAKRYMYYITESPRPSAFTGRYVWALGYRRQGQRMDVKLMQEAAEHLIGIHNFSRFGQIERDSSTNRSPIKHMFGISIWREKPTGGGPYSQIHSVTPQGCHTTVTAQGCHTSVTAQGCHTSVTNQDCQGVTSQGRHGEPGTTQHRSPDSRENHGVRYQGCHTCVTYQGCHRCVTYQGCHTCGGGVEEEQYVVISVVCTSFLWRMMRRITGTLVQIGLGKLDSNATRVILGIFPLFHTRNVVPVRIVRREMYFFARVI